MTYPYADLLAAWPAIAGEHAAVTQCAAFDVRGTLHVIVRERMSAPALAAVERAIRRRLPSAIAGVRLQRLKLHVRPGVVRSPDATVVARPDPRADAFVLERIAAAPRQCGSRKLRAAGAAAGVRQERVAAAIRQLQSAGRIAFVEGHQRERFWYVVDAGVRPAPSRLAPTAWCARCERPLEYFAFVGALAAVLRCLRAHCDHQHTWAQGFVAGAIGPQIVTTFGAAIGLELAQRFALPTEAPAAAIWSVSLSLVQVERCGVGAGAVLLEIARRSAGSGGREVA